MKKWLLSLFVGLCAVSGFAERSGDEILAFVRSKLPSDPIQLSGKLRVKSPNGYIDERAVQMELNWGATDPFAIYRIGETQLNIQWQGSEPQYQFRENGVFREGFDPNTEIPDTGVRWSDLSFSVLWWPNAQLVKEESKINRKCYVVDVPVPGSSELMRLWIEKEMGMLLEAQTLNAKKKMVRRMKIVSIKKMDGIWLAKDLEIDDVRRKGKTVLQIDNLVWGEEETMAEIEAYDPAENNNQFALELYRKLAVAKDGNLFLSPYSISMALAMTYGGARGDTATQMENVLHFGGQNLTHPGFAALAATLNSIQAKGDIKVNVANSLWPQKDVELTPEYRALIDSFYEAEATELDYKADPERARKTINDWVEKKTNDRIKNLVPQGSVNTMTRLILANAIYFNGAWKHPFEKGSTPLQPFRMADGSASEVQMMSVTESFNFLDAEGFQAIELPYKGDDLSMLILLPDEPDGLPALLPKITPEWLASLPLEKQRVWVRLPKFKLEYTFEVGDPLASMGMKTAFSADADFSGMTGSRDLFISAILHKAFVDVNEEGTEAAAATAVIMKATAAFSRPLQFNADHPFLFLIREKSTGSTLFIGQLVVPPVQQ